MKTHNIKVIYGSNEILNENRQGGSKAKKKEYILNAVKDVDSLLSTGEYIEIHFQQEGAKGWSKWSYIVGEKELNKIP